MSYVYLQSEPGLWTVGFYSPDGWVSESDHDDPDAAAQRVSRLNGGNWPTALTDAAPDLLALARRYASECGECSGTRVVPVGHHDRPDTDVPCGECADIWTVIDKAEGRA